MRQWFAFRPTLAIVAIVFAYSATLTGCQPGRRTPSPDKTPEHWQALARSDLDAVHEAIVAAHPGYIDAANTRPRAWAEQGYLAAQALIPRVASYDTMMSAVRYYVSGFQDGHLVYSDDIRSDDYHEVVTGWRVDERDGDAVVTAVMPGWDGSLPPLYSILLDCDGRTPLTIVAEDVAPYVDRRELPAVRLGLFSLIGSPRLAGLSLKRCNFRQADGSTLALDVRYRSISARDAWDGLHAGGFSHIPDRRNRYDFQDGVLWIRAINFMLNAAEAKELDVMLKQITGLRGVQLIVFDTRKNSGGDSVVGQQFLNSATGGLDFDSNDLDRLPRVYAQWRVSDIAIAGVGQYVKMMTERYGRSDPRTREVKRLEQRLRDARRAGREWVDSGSFPRMTRDEVAKRHGRLRSFKGTVAVITDGNCASACLDFVDQVRLIPGSVQLGQATSSDTVYLEHASVALPSGNHLAMPVKVWRNRVRGDGEVLIPDIPLNVDLNDEKLVRAAAIAALKKFSNQARSTAPHRE